MKATYVKPARTPITFEHASDVLSWALEGQIGGKPNDNVLALALAKTALETGRWTQIWKDNWGNVKAGSAYVGMYTCITLNELLMRGGKPKLVWFAPEGELSASPSKGGKLVGAPIKVPEGHAQTRMRAFANEYDGAQSYVEFVAGGYYKAAWSQLLNGDAVAYVRALKQAKYFTADEALYRKGVVSLHAEMLARLRTEEKPKPVDLEWERLVQFVPGIQFDLSETIDFGHGLDFIEEAA